MPRTLLHWVLCAVLIAISGPVGAQTNYPTRSVRLVVPTPPGGGTDIVARLIGQHLNELWGQPVVIENRGGGAGNIAAQSVARAAPDGYTLFVPFGGVMTINPFLYKNMGFDPEKDFAPVTMVASASYLMLVNPKLVEAKTVAEFIAYAKTQSEKINWASTNKGSPDHLAGELFSIMTRIPMNHIPYRGGAEALTDLIGGRMPLGFMTVPSSISHVASGTLRALGVSDAQRTPLLPDVPTIAEQSLPGYEIRTWYAVFAPAGTPQPVIEKLYQGIKTVLQYDAVQKRLRELGFAPGGMPPAEFAKAVKLEAEKYGKIIETVGLEKN